MEKRVTFSEILAGIFEPSAKVPLAKFMPGYTAKLRKIERVINRILDGDEMSALFWLYNYSRGINLSFFLYTMLNTYEDTFKATLETRQTESIGYWSFRSNFADCLQAIYCYMNQRPLNKTTKMDAIKYFMSNRINSKLSFVIMAYGLTSVISEAYWAKLVELNKGKPRIRVPFECQQCGRCCLKHGNCLKATEEDIKIWTRAGRTDILKWVGADGDLWIKESTGKEFWRCPFLHKVKGKNKYICKIYDAKPEVCRNYPVNKKQALKDGCPGIVKNEKEKTKSTQ